MPFIDTVAASLIGRGLKLPLEIDEETGGYLWFGDLDGFQKINQAIYLVINTRKGEVFMNPDFGSKVPDLLFDPLDDVLLTQLDYEVRKAINTWIPQIQLISIQVNLDQADPNLAHLSGVYNIRNTPAQGSFVYPFRIGAGTLS